MESNQSELASQFRRSLSIPKEKRSHLVSLSSFYCILILYLFVGIRYFLTHHYLKSVPIRSFSGPYFPAYGLNAVQKNSEYGHFSRSVFFTNVLLYVKTFSMLIEIVPNFVPNFQEI